MKMPHLEVSTCKAGPYKNTCIESFHATLKKEGECPITYTTFERTRMALFQYIEGRVLALVED